MRPSVALGRYFSTSFGMSVLAIVLSCCGPVQTVGFHYSRC